MYCTQCHDCVGDNSLYSVRICIHIVGREARTYGLGLDEAKVALDPKSGKIVVDSADATTAGHIFAIGDAINVSKSIP